MSNEPGADASSNASLEVQAPKSEAGADQINLRKTFSFIPACFAKIFRNIVRNCSIRILLTTFGGWLLRISQWIKRYRKRLILIFVLICIGGLVVNVADSVAVQ